MKNPINRGGLKLTTLWYYLPSGRNVKSLTPDLRIAVRRGEHFVHPPMPYAGPQRIRVVKYLDGRIHDHNRFDFKRAGVIFETMEDSEAVGKALVLRMLTGAR